MMDADEIDLKCDNCEREQRDHDRTIIACSDRCMMQLADVAPSPQWTTTPPTEPGWYWAFAEGEIFVGEVFVRGESVFLSLAGAAPARLLADFEFTLWLRIEAPEVPK